MNRFDFQAVIRRLFKQAGGTVSDLLFPSKCLDCGIYFYDRKTDPLNIESFFCRQCLGDGLIRFEPPYCTRCGRLFKHKSIDSHVCEACLKKPLRIGKVRAAVHYDGVMKKALPMFKYQGRRCLSPLFENLVARCYLRHFSDTRVDLIVPVPLHRKRVMARGFNQAYFLVRHLDRILKHGFGYEMSAEVDIGAVVRIKRTAPQTGFDVIQRRRNLKNAFKVIDPGRVKKKSILLVDDVFTTGTTCNELSAALLRQGAGQVNALVLARA